MPTPCDGCEQRVCETNPPSFTRTSSNPISVFRISLMQPKFSLFLPQQKLCASFPQRLLRIRNQRLLVCYVWLVMASSPNQVVALPAPPGQVSNLINPKSFASWNLVCVAICLVTTTTVFLLRSYVRLWIKRQWILEDCECFLCAMAV